MDDIVFIAGRPRKEYDIWSHRADFKKVNPLAICALVKINLRGESHEASGEVHLLAGAAVVALRYLHAPENALVLRAQLSKVSESESSHPAVV